MFLRITDEVASKFPEAILGVVIAHDIDNTGEDAEVIGLLRKEEARAASEFGNAPVTQHPHIAAWREAYKKFGAQPKKHASSIESLARRVLKGQSVPHINKLVDIYNTASLRHIVPVGGEDLDKIEGDVLLAIAGDNEPPVRLLGESDERPPYPNEVIYKDSLSAICRRWNWKEADRTKFTQQTKRAFIVVEGLPPAGKAIIERAINDLAEMVSKYCGGAIATAILDTENREIDLMKVS